jgi:hypothetical protein
VIRANELTFINPPKAESRPPMRASIEGGGDLSRNPVQNHRHIQKDGPDQSVFPDIG